MNTAFQSLRLCLIGLTGKNKSKDFCGLGVCAKNLVSVLALSLGCLWGSEVSGQVEFENLTVSGDALFKSGARFGDLFDGEGGHGFKIEVAHVSREVEVSVWADGGDPYEETTWVEEWGWLGGGYHQDVYQDVEVEVWTEAQGYYEPQGTGNYDEHGVEEMQEVWIQTSEGYWSTEYQSQWVSSEWVPGDTYWGVVDSRPETNLVTPEGYWTTSVANVFDAPVIQLKANRSSSVWQWSNPAANGANRVLMELKETGLSFPGRSLAGWDVRSLHNEQEVRLSETLETGVNSLRQAYGTTVTRDGVEVWGEEGGAISGVDRLLSPAMASSSKLDHHSLHLSRSYETPESERVTKVTRLLPDHAEFGGSVIVHGVIRMRPAGDISMGAYTNGPEPE